MKTRVIADCSINHSGNILRALYMIESAKKCGCNAVMFGASDGHFDSSSEEFCEQKRLYMDYDKINELKKQADKIGIEFISSPRDLSSLEFLSEELGVRTIKILSQDFINIELIKAINKLAKKYYDFNVIVSTKGKSSYDTTNILSYMPDVSLLTLEHCSSEDCANLSAIRTMGHMIHGNRKVGYADYTQGIISAASSVLVGAKLVEKSFIIRTRDRGNDEISATPDMMQDMIEMIEQYEQILGSEEIIGERNEKVD